MIPRSGAPPRHRSLMVLAVLGCATSCSVAACGGTSTASPSHPARGPAFIGPRGLVAYVADTYDQGAGYVEPVCLATGKVGRRIPVGGQPFVIEVSPDGRWAYVANSGWDGPRPQSTVTPVDLTTGQASPPIEAGLGPMGIAITPDGSRAYVADMGSFLFNQSTTMVDADTVTPIDLVTRRALAPIHVGPGVGAVSVTPDGTRAVVAIDGTDAHPQGYVEVLNLTSGMLSAPIPVGAAPMAIAITPDNREALVTDTGFRPLGHFVSVVDLAANRPIKDIRVGTSPIDIVLTPDGRKAFVANATVGRGDSFAAHGTVSTIHVASLTAGPAISVPGVPQSLAITPDGKTVYAVGMVSYGRSALTAIDAASGAVKGSVSFSSNLGAVAVAPSPRGFCT